MDGASCRLNFTCETFESRRLSSAIHTQKSKALAWLETKRDVFDGNKGLWLAAVFRERVHLAKVLYLYSELIVRCRSYSLGFKYNIRVKLDVFIQFRKAKSYAALPAFPKTFAKVRLNNVENKGPEEEVSWHHQNIESVVSPVPRIWVDVISISRLWRLAEICQ